MTTCLVVKMATKRLCVYLSVANTAWMLQAEVWISQAEWMKQDTILLGMTSNLGFTSCFFFWNFPLNILDRYWPQVTENSRSK